MACARGLAHNKSSDLGIKAWAYQGSRAVFLQLTEDARRVFVLTLKDVENADSDEVIELYFRAEVEVVHISW